jgi:uncharacterized membrane protein
LNERTQTVVDDYLHRLERELELLPRGRRREILCEIKGHFGAAALAAVLVLAVATPVWLGLRLRKRQLA